MIERFVAIVVAGTVPDPSLADAIAGDLLEDLALVALARGRFAASAWLARQLVTSIPHFASLVPNDARECFMARAFVRFYSLMAVFIAVSVLLVRGFDWAARESATPMQLMVAIVSSIIASGLAGFAAARLVKRLALVSSLAVGLSSLAIGVGALLEHAVHAAPVFWPAILIVVIPATLAGGLFRAWQLARETMVAG